MKKGLALNRETLNRETLSKRTWVVLKNLEGHLSEVGYSI